MIKDLDKKVAASNQNKKSVLKTELSAKYVIVIVGSLIGVCAVVFLAISLPSIAGRLKKDDPSGANLRFIAATVTQYADDHGGVLPGVQDAASLQQFVAGTGASANKKLWENPLTHEPYLPNPALSGKKISDFDRAKVVAVYEAKESGGKRRVAMLDGHDELVKSGDWPAMKAISGLP